MLVTVLQRRHNRWLVVNQYHAWSVPDDPDQVLSRIPCPGCGQVMHRQQFSEYHRCRGELTDRPVDRTKFTRNRRWTPRQGEPDDVLY